MPTLNMANVITRERATGAENSPATFPLIIWQQTEAFQELLQSSNDRFGKLVDEWDKPWDLGQSTVNRRGRVNVDGEIEFWISDQVGLVDDKKPFDQAEKDALVTAATGWWIIEDFEDFFDKKGPLFQKAMLLQGFRPHKKIAGRWARAGRKYRDEESAKRMKERGKEFEEKWPVLSDKESQELSSVWLAPNDFVGTGRKYSASVGRNGLIHISLNANPFSAVRTDQLDQFSRDLANRGHIAREQEGFIIEANNIRSGEEKGIYIRAIKTDNSYVECVWPVSFPAADLYDLAEKFVGLVNTA